MKITINGKVWTLFQHNDKLSYERVVEHARMKGYPTVTYRGPKNGDTQRQGEMHVGCADVALEDGMAFNVVHTGNA